MTIAATPEPPYTAVIFSSLRTEGDQGYDAMARRMFDLAAEQPGHLGAGRASTAAGGRRARSRGMSSRQRVLVSMTAR
jgi:antibiotic biosynthesis monooxygenase (ABM) superfamily enzyme